VQDSAGAHNGGLWRANVDEIRDQLQIGDVMRHQRNSGDVCRGGDRQVHGAPARPASALGDGRGEATPLACDGRVDGQRIERGFDDPEPQRSTTTLIRVAERAARKRQRRR
jgi:hypothetical protein